MLRNVFIPLILLGCLLAASCGGGTTSRDLSGNGDDAFLLLDATAVNYPARVRCVASCPTLEVLSWSWGVNNGRVVSQDDASGVAWISIDEPGACVISARGVDKDGKDCTTPRGIIRASHRNNAPPVQLCAEPTDSPFFKQVDGQRLRYHRWRWAPVCYDPDDASFRCDTDFSIANPGEGTPDIYVVEMAADGSVKIAGDWDGDGVDDDCDGAADRSFPAVHVFEVRCPSKSKEDVYVWKVRMSSGESSKKEFKGHVTLLK
jgi:hypothetical protein